MDWYLKVLKNYLGFGGRARRKEYWMFILVNIIFTFVLGLLDAMLGWQRAGGEGVLTTIYGVLIFLPWWAVQFRRLHDTDRSAWWLRCYLSPLSAGLSSSRSTARMVRRATTASAPIRNVFPDGGAAPLLKRRALFIFRRIA